MTFENIITGDRSTFLNILRIFSSELVVFGHLYYWGLKDQYGIPMQLANFGVIIFFILSGILISNSVFSKLNKGYTFKEFFIDRFSRIYSGLFPCMIFIAVLDGIHLVFFKSHYVLEYSAFDDFNIVNFIGTIFQIQGPGIFPPILDYMNIGSGFGSGLALWSLGIEWWMYMLFGWIFLYMISTKFKDLTSYIVLIFFSVIPTLYLFTFFNGGSLFILPIIWATGSVAVVIINKMSFPPIQKIALFVGGMMFIGSFISMISLMTNPFYPSNCFIMILAILLILIGLKDTKYFINVQTFFKWFADYSFTLYIIHVPIIIFISIFISARDQFIIFCVISFIVTNLISAIFAIYTEHKYKSVSKWLKKY